MLAVPVGFNHIASVEMTEHTIYVRWHVTNYVIRTT